MAAIVPAETIFGKIYLIRGANVMIDRDLAALYEVETGQLTRAVRRNIDRFLDDFMFELTKEELKNWTIIFFALLNKPTIPGSCIFPKVNPHDTQIVYFEP